MKKLIISLPIIVTFTISYFLLVYLMQNKDPNIPPSALLNKKVPEIELINLFNDNELIKPNDFNDSKVLINFFASWCIPCKAEHHIFFKIKQKYPEIFIIGINHKDKKTDALNYLNTEGNPYDYIGVDKEGFIGLEFGVFGLPETFLINSSGEIIYKHLGPLTKEVIKDDIQPLL